MKVHQNSDWINNHLRDGGTSLFNKENFDWGLSKLITIKTLLDKSNGYVKVISRIFNVLLLF